MRHTTYSIPLLLALAALTSCGTNASARRTSDPNAPVTTGLAALAQGDTPTPAAELPDPSAPAPGSVDALARQSALDLERALAESSKRDPSERRAADPHGAAPSTGLIHVERATPHDPQTSSAGEQPTAGLAGEQASSSPSGASAPGAGLNSFASNPPASADVASLAASLSAALQSRASGSSHPLGDLALAASLSALTGSPLPDASALSPTDRAALEALRTLHASLGSQSEQDAAELLQAAADAAAKDLPVRITDVRLCTRVGGFGDFVEVSRPAFLAGRPNPVIVYVQVDRFASRLGSGGGRTVELSQELNIYHDSDGAHCWKRPAQTVLETARAARRDFFLADPIELPSTLTVGKYRLKVTMRDATSGAVAERIIPFSIVADPSLAHAAR